jgi:hypothetical protein
MTNAVHAQGDWRYEASRFLRVSGAWRRVVGMAVRLGDVWHSVDAYSPSFTASAPEEVDGYGVAQKPIAETVSATASITVNGGTSPYSYQWSRVSGDSRITSKSPTMATSTFAATLRSEQASAVFGWIATDANGQSVTGQTTVVLSSGAF